MIYHAMLHEIGHSIGIEGHSLYSGDIMSTGIRVPVAHLSQRDKNTARILYQTYKKEPTTSEIKTAKEQELKSLAAKIPNDPSSYIDLGDEYMAAGEYNKAIDSYNKALKVKKNIPTYYRLTKAYKAVHDSDNLIVTYKSILALNPADKSALSGALMVYYEQYRIKDGAELLNAFIAKNPSQTNDADILKFKAMFSPAVHKRIEANEKHLKLKER
jgi:tetratricopeptide (TPR) repeat protein